jgi:hypothetical protein
MEMHQSAKANSRQRSNEILDFTFIKESKNANNNCLATQMGKGKFHL